MRLESQLPNEQSITEDLKFIKAMRWAEFEGLDRMEIFMCLVEQEFLT